MIQDDYESQVYYKDMFYFLRSEGSMCLKRRVLTAAAWVVFAAGLVVPASAQTFRANLFEISPFAGGTFYKDVKAGPGADLSAGPVFGGRVTENLWRHFGLEQSVGYNRNHFNFLTPIAGVVVMNQDLGTRVLNANLDGLYYFKDRGARVRPFLAAGIGGARFSPTGDAKNFFLQNSIKPTGQLLREETRGQYNYGGGVKIRFNDLIGMRFDARGLVSRNPTFGMSTINNGQAFIPNGSWLNALEATAGIVFNLGGGMAPVPMSVSSLTVEPASAIIGAPGVTGANLVGLNANNSICAGTPVHVSATVSNVPKGRMAVYHWTVNGMMVGGDSNMLTYTPAQPGVYQVALSVSETGKKPPAAISPMTVAVYARDCTPHQISMGPITSVPPGAIVNGTGVTTGNAARLAATATDPLGHRLAYHWTVNGQPYNGDSNTITVTPSQAGQTQVGLQVTDTDQNAAMPASPAPVVVYANDLPQVRAVCSATNGNLTLGQSTSLSAAVTGAQGASTIRWTVSEGTLANGNTATPTFNSTGINFPASAQPQTKTITATANVTDAAGRMTSCTTNIRVTVTPMMVHYGDIVFGQGSARINNCAKRILIERVYPQLAPGGAYQGFNVVLVGHIDPSESKIRDLDRKRVLDAAAVLSAGKDTCTALEPMRIQGDWVGTTATEYKETSCGVTFNASPTERAVDRINPNDARAKNRRVEVWLVPPGQAMPASVKEAHSMPLPELQRLACPR